jgi:hypothetical protein
MMYFNPQHKPHKFFNCRKAIKLPSRLARINVILRRTLPRLRRGKEREIKNKQTCRAVSIFDNVTLSRFPINLINYVAYKVDDFRMEKLLFRKCR